MAEETKGWLHGWMTQLAKEIEEGVKAEGYKLSAETGKGPLVYITVTGAEGDTSAFKKLKPEIEKVVMASIDKHVKDPEFKVSITSGSRGDDMKIVTEILFPKA